VPDRLLPAAAKAGSTVSESVWDYPRPPRVEPAKAPVRVRFAGRVIADSGRALRVLETSHPPVYYIPQEDIQMEYLSPAPGSSFCEFKGQAVYWTVAVEGRSSEKAAWSYPAPSASFAAIRDHLAFYASRVDECFVGDHRVQAQPGDFYGGWITPDIEGPFKGGPGTAGW
jgi:uncharacterized protein (DUF427 family)